MAANIELKARLTDLASARSVALRLAPQGPQILRQTDTYFCSRRGRLKLREMDAGAELVWYQRPDHLGPTTSDYRLIPVPQPDALKLALTAALGIWVVVRKRREVYLYENVRIHLDEVQQLGSFLEFEAVLSPRITAAQGRAQVERLQAEFGVCSGDLITGSYSDLLDLASS